MCVDVWVFAVSKIEWCFRDKCFPDALTPRVYSVRCGPSTHLRMRSAPPPRPALTVSQRLSDWTGSKGSLSLSVSFLHIDLNDFFFFFFSCRPPRLLLRSLPLPSLLRRLLACTQRTVQNVRSCETSTGFPRNWHFRCTYYFDVIWPFSIYIHTHTYISKYIHVCMFAPFGPRLDVMVQTTPVWRAVIGNAKLGKLFPSYGRVRATVKKKNRNVRMFESGGSIGCRCGPSSTPAPPASSSCAGTRRKTKKRKAKWVGLT